MRIALIAPLPPEQNGIADYADAFSQALETCGICVVTPFKDNPLPTDPARLHIHMQTVDWGNLDVVHAELGGGRVGEFLALEWLQHHHPNLPMTATVHDPERLIWRAAGESALWRHLPRRLYQIAVVLTDFLTLRRERQLAKRFSRLITLTRTGAKCLITRMRLPSLLVTSIPHGNRLIRPAPLPPIPPLGPLRILYFGFIYRGKGIEDLIDALAQVAKRRPEVTHSIQLTLAGGSQPEMAFGASGSYLDELKNRLAETQLTGMGMEIDWHLDIPQEKIAALIQSHHVVVLPYRESKKLALLGQLRGTSGVLSWAAACGRSVISSDARAFSEELSYGNGAVYPQGDAGALASQILLLLQQPTLIAQRSESAQMLGVQRAWSNIADQFKTLFEQTIKGSESC